jgi:hypothetical protein
MAPDSDISTLLSAEAIAGHPLFASVVAEYTARLLVRRRGEILLNRVLAQREREMLAFLLLCEHYAALEGGPPPTLARLLESGLGSRRRIIAFVGLLRMSGLAQAERDSHDRRRQILAPTERLIAFHRDWTRAALRQLDRLLDRPCLELALDADPGFHRRACIAGAPEIFGGGRFDPGRFPLVDFLTPHRGGHLIAAALANELCAAWHARGEQPASVALPYGRLAKRLGVSRSHVLNVFREAEALGFLHSAEAGEAIRLSDSSRADLRGYFAHELAFIARHALAALRGPPSAAHP